EVRVDTGRDDGRVSRKGIRQAGTRRCWERTCRLPLAERRVSRKWSDAITNNLVIVENSETGSNHGTRSSKRPPGQPESRRQIVPVSIPKPAPNVGTRTDQKESRAWIYESLEAARDLDRVGIGIEGGHLVHPFQRRQVQLVAKPEVQGQVSADLPVILKVVTGAESHGVMERLSEIAVSLGGHAQ